MSSRGFWLRAQEDPTWIAVVEPDGTEHPAGDVLARANQLTHALRARGLKPGDGIASLLPNGVAPVEVYLAALQAGWYLTPINWHFTAPEVGLHRAGLRAKAFFVHERFAELGTDTADRRASRPTPGSATARYRALPRSRSCAPGSRRACPGSAPRAPPCTTPRAPPAARRASAGR